MKRVKIGSIAIVNPMVIRKGLHPEDIVPFLAMADISDDGQIINIQERSYHDVKVGYTGFEQGDILLAKITPCFENGKCLLVNLDRQFKTAFGSTEFHIIRPGADVDARYLFHAVANKKFRFLGQKAMTGAAGQRRVPVEFITNFQISLPSLEEQRRIAVILDKADTMRRKRQEALKLVDNLVKSRFIEMFGDPVTNPMGWEMPCLENLAASSKNALKAGPFGSSLKKEDYTEKGYKIYGQEQVIKGDAFYGDYYISEQKYDALKSCAVSEGDVLISLVGTYGKVLIVPCGFEPGIINPRLVKISFDKNKINTVFFEHFFASESLKAKLDSNTNGCTMGVLNLGIIKKINVPLPPLPLQNQFAIFVEQVDKSKFAMQCQLEKAETTKAALMQEFF